MRLIILGGTGSGKGTQAEKLSDALAIGAIATGNILRNEIEAATELGLQAKNYVEQGELVSDRLMIELIKARIQQPDVASGWILEGYPRTAFQAEELDFSLGKKQKLDWAIYLKVGDRTMIQRALARGLADDQLEVIQRRLKAFHQRTLPMLEYYDYRGKLLKVDGEQTPDRVFDEIMAAIK